MTRILSTALLLLALIVPLRGGEPNAEQFKALCGVAQDMDHTTIGMAYEEHFSQAIQNDMSSALNACAARSKPPYWVNLVFVIAANGAVEHIFADPAQPVSACVAAKLSREKVPPPPRPPAPSAHWLLLVNIHINE